MSFVGAIENYNEGTSWQEYKERFVNFMQINKITDDVLRSSYLVTFGGPILYSKMKDACFPDNPNTIKYSELIPKLDSLITPRTQQLLERAAFYERSQKPGESYSDYALALRHMSQTCDFGTHLDACLRDKFVTGIRKMSTRVAVIRSNKATFNEVVAEAQVFELTEGVETSNGIGAVKSYCRTMEMVHVVNQIFNMAVI